MIDVQIPKMGMSTVEVGITALHVKIGDRVEPATVIADIESEKATVQIEAGSAGTVVQILVAEGDEANVGDVLVRLEP